MRFQVGTAVVFLLSAACGDAAGPSGVARIDVDSYGTAYVGGTLQMSATVFDHAGRVLTDRAVTWTSSNEIAATVSTSGLVYALSEATSVTITATCEGVSGTSKVRSLIDLRGRWTGSTPNRLYYTFTLTGNDFCPQAACASAGYGVSIDPTATYTAYTIGYGERLYGSISFELWNDSDQRIFRGRYDEDATKLTGTLDGVPIVFTRTS